MSDNPYGDHGNEFGSDEPQRTSALAIGSIVCSLICCLPVVPLLGAGLGVGAVIGIGGSNGRVGGKGLAIAGIIIGVLVTIAQVAAFVTAKQGIDMGVRLVYGSAHELMEDIESGDYDSARALLTGAGSTLPDGNFDVFRDAYRAEYGSFQSIPTGLGDLISAYSQVGQQMQNYQPQGQQNIVPAPGYFDSGMAIVIAQIPQNGQPTGTPGQPDFLMPLLDVRIVMPDGSELGLLSGASAPPPAPADADTDDDTDEDIPEDDGP